MRRKPPPRLALRYELGGELRTLPLGPGETSIGSHRDNTVVLRHEAVSRHHAVVRVSGEGTQLEDLGSKNGTRLDGRRVSRASLAAGSSIALGPLLLDVVAVDPDDVELAIDLGLVPDARAAGPGESRATRTAAAEAPAARGLALLARLAGPLLSGEGAQLARALDALRAELGAATIILLEEREGGDPAVVSLQGDPGPAAAAARLAFDPAAPDEPTTCRAAAPSPGGAPWALVAVGARWDPPDTSPLLEVVLRLAAAGGRPRPPLGADGPEPPQPELAFPSGHVPGRSEAMRALYAQLRTLAPGDVPVLVTGETGVGKEHVARILHASSPARSRGPFQAVNCAAVPAELLEAELFGVEKGAATGVAARPGQFQLAHRGTLFLDEIGDMPPGLQAKLLRVLQSLEVTPVGGRRAEKVDVRIVAATNADPGQLLDQGRLRPDLFYRVAGWTVHVPSLRERRDDVPPLVEALLRRFAAESGKPVRGVSLKALSLLVAAPWPGNVRQLEHQVRRLVHLCPRDGVIDAPLVALVKDGGSPAAAGDDDGGDLALQPRIDELERRLIRAALARTSGHRSQAAALLGVSRDGLRMKMTRLGLGE